MPVEELGLEVPTRIPSERAEVVEVHDVRAVDAHETLRIESLFKATQREVQRVARALGMAIT